MIHYPLWKRVFVLLVMGFAILSVLPNLLTEQQRAAFPAFLPSQSLNLGLDLQGGAHLLLEVDTDDLIAVKLGDLRSALRSALRAGRIRYQGGLQVRENGLMFSPGPGQMDEALRIARDLALEQTGLLSLNPLQIFGHEPDVGVSREGGTVILAFSDQAVIRLKSQAIEQSIEIIRRRVDETGVREPTIQRQGLERIIVQLPGVSDPERIKDLIGKTARLTFHMVDQEVPTRARAARGLNQRVLPDIEVDPNGQPIAWYVLEGRALFSGEQLISARQGYDQNNLPAIDIGFDLVGAKRFADTTRANVGRRFAIVLDSQVLTAPVIREAIPSGQAQISGNFTIQAAQDLSVLLRAGALPAPLTVLEERTVGPGLGADSIAAGKIASLLAALAVAISILVLYGPIFGGFACLALLLNLISLAALLTLLQATLTLPGIAGIVLTVGMAVDANVLIFERIREENAAGRGPVGAVDAGFSRAFGTIVDSNITSLIAGMLLLYFGSGPVRGFAVTFSFGIMTSMFTTIMITRMLIILWLKARPQARLPIA